MAFDASKNNLSKMPIWMQTLIDRNSVDAWTEDPDYVQSNKRSISKSTKGNKQIILNLYTK